MAVAFDQTGVASGADVTGLTIAAFTPGGADRVDYVGVGQHEAETVTSVKKGGVDYTSRARIDDVVGGEASEIFELIAPAASSSTVVGVFSNAEGVGVTMGHVSMTGAHQTTPRLTTTTNTGVGDPTVTHTSTTDGFDFMTFALARDLNYTASAGTERWDVLQADEPSSGGITDPGAVSNTMTADYPQNREWSMCAVAIQVPSAGGRIMSSLAKAGGLTSKGGIAGIGGGLAGRQWVHAKGKRIAVPDRHIFLPTYRRAA